MKKYYPSYYEKFSCIAGECPDSCCKAWEIIIDKNTYNKYLNINDSIGEIIRDCIITDIEGDKCFSLVDGRCPFLNDEGLCDIHLRLGEGFTSEICRTHPRFVEEYDGFTEVSLSLSCPEACRLIFFSDINKNCYPTPEYHGDDEVLGLLIASREKLLEKRCDYKELQQFLLYTSADDSLDIDLVYISDFPDFSIEFIKQFAEKLQSLEILTDEWKDYLGKCVDCEPPFNCLQKYYDINNEKLCKLCKYLIYRYYLKAVNDLDIYSRALFIASACNLCLYISEVCSISFENAVRLFSKETEHNPENTDAIIEYFSNF